MVEAWTDPKTWANTDTPSGDNFNTYIRDNQEYLFKRPLDFVNHVFSVDEELSVLSTWTKIDEFDLTLTTKTGRIKYSITIPINGNQALAFDVYVPELNIWLSSGTATKTINGMVYRRADSVNNDIPAVGVIVRDLITPAAYSFHLYYFSGSATVIDIPADYLCSVIVEEL